MPKLTTLAWYDETFIPHFLLTMRCSSCRQLKGRACSTDLEERKDRKHLSFFAISSQGMTFILLALCCSILNKAFCMIPQAC